ncbi:Signal transduction histidine kinase [Lentibacillus halodurans]|uniref:histidine kinase n=1 Tax=Lentibacillus halodurans TaxID=237679 RepID=A0A1I0Y0U6_9BACI|nr:HAMP domain-containing sensor histidine kinase [Lentibacillus halodurans]SFB06794.1 Signal transduction histidine kinase [Lentibacillus halodurans]
MSIQKRLLLSNIAMIVIPIIGFFLIEIMLGYVLFVAFDGNPEGAQLKAFISLRFIGMLLILVVTNGLLTYFVSRSIIKPVRRLSKAAAEISEGNLDYSIVSSRNDELGLLSDTFESMRLKLKEANKLQNRYEENRKELIASISHDLKTPMTSIKGYVKGVQDGVADTPEKLDRYMETIYRKANEMDALIDELSLYSKLDLERIPFAFEELDLYAFFSDFAEELRLDLEQNGGTVNFQADWQNNYFVEADRDQLKRAVTNIVQNSLKHMDKQHKKMAFHLTAGDGYVLVEIQDNGNGISEENVPLIFDSFYRADASRNAETGGSGLGLAIVKRIVTSHGGEIWADSRLGEETRICFTLRKKVTK